MLCERRSCRWPMSPSRESSTVFGRPGTSSARSMANFISIQEYLVLNWQTRLNRLRSRISKISDLRSQISDLGSQISDLRSQISDLRFKTYDPTLSHAFSLNGKD